MYGYDDHARPGSFRFSGTRPPKGFPLDVWGRMSHPSRRSLASAVDELEALGYGVSVTRTAPKWQLGDVVGLRFGANPTVYTYGFDGRHFPGRRTPVSAEEMTRAWREGRATLLVRDGVHYHDVPPKERTR